MVSLNSIIMTTVIVFGVFDNYTYAIIDYEPDVCMEKLQSISHNTNQNISTEPDFNCIHYRGMSMKPSTDHGYEMLFQGYIQASLGKIECALKFRQWCLLFAAHNIESCLSELIELGYTGEDIEQDHITAKTLTLSIQQHVHPPPLPAGKPPKPPKPPKGHVKIPPAPKVPQAPRLMYEIGSFSHRYSFYLIGFTSRMDMPGAPSEAPSGHTKEMTPQEFCLESCISEIRLAGFASGNAKKNFDVLRKQFGEEIPSNSNGKIPSQGVLKRKLPPINFEVYGYADSYAMYLLIHYQFINDGINGLLDGIRWCNEKLGVGTETEEEISSPYQNMGNQSPYQNMGNQSPYQNMGNPFPYQNMGSPSPYKNMGNPSPYQNMENSPNYHPGYPLNNQIGGKPPSIKVPNKDTVNQPTHQMGYQGNYQNPRMVPSQYNMKNQDGYHNY